MIIWIHGGLLLQLLQDELAARGLHALLLVRGGVVAQLLAVGQALRHCWVVGLRTAFLSQPFSLEPRRP